MKKSVIRLALAAVMLAAAPGVKAQDLSGILGGVLGSGSGSDLVSNLTSVFSSSKQATQEKIVGTWKYSEPAIVFTSDNLLAKTAAKVAAGKLETKLQSYLTQYGIKPGAMSLTFKEDGTFTQTVSGKTTSGKWAISNSKLQLTIGGVKAPSVTTQIDGSDMQLVTDATKLLNLFKTMGAKSTNSNIKTVTTLMKSVNGMQAGLTLRKQ